MKTLLAQVARIVADRGGGTVEEVRVECGALCGVEPELVAAAFARLALQNSVAGAQLVIKTVPLAARCRACSEPFEPERFRFRCPTCGSTDVQVTDGEAFVLESIEFTPSTTGVPA